MKFKQIEAPVFGSKKEKMISAGTSKKFAGTTVRYKMTCLVKSDLKAPVSHVKVYNFDRKLLFEYDWEGSYSSSDEKKKLIKLYKKHGVIE